MKAPANLRRTRELWRATWRQMRARCWVIREKRKPSVWAAQVRRIPAGGSPIADEGEAIPYSHELFPHCVEQMDSADDPTVRKIVIWAGIRDGKTMSVCANIIGRTVTDDPGNIYSVHPIDDDVERFSGGDVEPMIDACLKGYFVEKKSRDTGRTINFKKFRGGWLRIVNAGSLTKFRGTSVKVLLMHELDALDPEAIFKALGRTTGYRNAIIVMESTGTFAASLKPDGSKEYHSHIEAAYDEGDKRKWFCKCKKCDALQTLKYEQIQYPAGRMDLAKYHCERCDYAHTPAEWRKLAAGGKWYPTAGLTAEQEADIERNHKLAIAKDPGTRSYWRNGFNSLLPHSKGFRSKLHQFASEGVSAQRTKEGKRVWLNEVKAELVPLSDEELESPPWQPILDGREDYATSERVTIPAAGLVVTAMTDLQSNRLEIEWRAWGKLEESWGLGHHVLFGDTTKPEVWDEWTRHLQKKWQHASGAELGLSLALVDGGWRLDPIMATLRRLREKNVPGVSGKIIVSKGVPKWNAVIHNKWATIEQIARKISFKGIHIGTWCAKSLIYERLKWHSADDKPSAGFIHFGKNYDDDFIRQCVTERPVMKIIEGREVETFKNPEGARNEGLDLLVGNLAAFRRKRWDFDTIEREIAEQVKAKAEPERPKPKPIPPPPQRQPSLVARLRNPWG